MRIRFQADADLNQSIVVGLLRRLPEVDVLALAARDGRVLVTHDKSTMPTHFGEFIRTRQSPGVVVVLQSMPVGTVLDELTLIWGASQASEWANRIAFLPL